MGIYWIIGNSQAGKSTFSRLFSKFFDKVFLLDADEIRNTINKDLGFSKEDRIKNNERIMELALLARKQGFTVIISSICPYESLRKKIHSLTNCQFIYVTGGKKGKDYPFEPPIANVLFTVKGNEND